MSLDVKVPLTCVTVGEACQCCLCRAVKQCGGDCSHDWPMCSHHPLHSYKSSVAGGG